MPGEGPGKGGQRRVEGLTLGQKSGSGFPGFPSNRPRQQTFLKTGRLEIADLHANVAQAFTLSANRMHICLSACALKPRCTILDMLATLRHASEPITNESHRFVKKEGCGPVLAAAEENTTSIKNETLAPD